MTEIPDEARAILESDALAHLVTSNADGSAQVSCVWVGLEGSDIVFASLGPRRKLDNIRRDPRVTLSLEGTETERHRPQGVPRRPRPRAHRRGGRARAAAAPGPHLPRARREVPAHGRPAARRRRAHRRGAPGRRRPLGLTRLGVLGWPVAHSRSPAMHNAALRAVGLTRLALPAPAGPARALRRDGRAPCRRAGFAGANVTIPHKEAALALADEATDAARAIGAANTLTFAPGGAVAADNTDAPGLLAALGDLRPRARPGPRRGRLGARRGLRAGAGGRRRGGLEPHARARPGAGGRSRRAGGRRARCPPTCSSTAPPWGSPIRRARSRNSL